MNPFLLVDGETRRDDSIQRIEGLTELVHGSRYGGNRLRFDLVLRQYLQQRFEAVDILIQTLGEFRLLLGGRHGLQRRRCGDDTLGLTREIKRDYGKGDASLSDALKRVIDPDEGQDRDSRSQNDEEADAGKSCI
jgi:hypothetical protein